MSSADIVDYYANHAERFLARRSLADPGSGEAVIESSPIGVLFGVEPWNFPYYQLGALCSAEHNGRQCRDGETCGCVPQCAIAFEKLWLEAACPPRSHSILRISHDQVARVIADPRIKGVALTGGTLAGKIVAAAAGRNMKKSTMELGGNDAFIVLGDADLEKTVAWAVWARMNNTGQCCVAGKRFIVVEESWRTTFSTSSRPHWRHRSQAIRWIRGRRSDPCPRKKRWVNWLDEVNRAVANGATVVMGGSE